MPDDVERSRRLRDVFDWFGSRGFGIVVTEDEGEFWAHLFPVTALVVSVPRYGRGGSVEEAGESARTRYAREEEPVK